LKVQLYAILHDAHEAITGDIPQPWKTDDMRALQQNLDYRIWSSLKLSQPDLVTQRTIHQIDNQMVYHEATHVAPQVAEAIREPGPNFRDSIQVIDDDARVAVQEWLPYEISFHPERWGKTYKNIVEELIRDCR
jgi:hypothetical protein